MVCRNEGPGAVPAILPDIPTIMPNIPAIRATIPPIRAQVAAIAPRFRGVALAQVTRDQRSR